MNILSGSNSACFDHDVMVRNAWVSKIQDDVRAKIRAIAPAARFDLYRDIDTKIKTRYLETLRSLNKELEVIQLKGFGPLRQSKNQQPLDFVLMDVATDILIETGFIVSN